MRNSWMTKAQEIQERANNNNIRAFYEALKSVFGPIRRSFCHVKDNTGTLLIKECNEIFSRWAEHFNTLLNKKNPSDTSFLDSPLSLPPIACLDHTHPDWSSISHLWSQIQQSLWRGSPTSRGV